MKKLYLAVALLLLVNLNSVAQKYELGKVTIEELSEKKHPKDTSAVGAILFEKGLVKFELSDSEGFEMVSTTKQKIKIYKKDGYDLGNISIDYYIGNSSSREKVNVSEAVTYNLVGGKIEKTKLKSDGEFNENINKYWGRKKITMPNVREGSIIEIEYTTRSVQKIGLDDWAFQSFIPVNYSEYKTIVPEFFIYKEIQKGFIFPKITKEKNTVTINSNDKSRMSGGGATTTSFSNSQFDYQEEKSTYVMENIPALKNESYVNNIDNYRASIAFELAMTKYPGQPYKTLSTDWTTLTKTIYDSDNFGVELNKVGYFEDDLKTILAGLNSRDEKIATVYNFVKSKMKWDDYASYYCDKGVRKAYKDMTGNVAEINLMLTAMLRYAGLDANPVLVSTRDNGVALFPNRTAYNYVISAVETEKGMILLDATSKYALPNILPTRNLNWFGRLIRKDGTSAEIDLMPKMVSKDVVNVIASISNDGTVEGKIREQYFDYNAYLHRARYAELSNDTQMERIEKEDKGLEISDYDFANKSELDKPVVENYNFRHTNSVEVIGDKMYFSPMLSFALTENPFRQDTREYPMDFSYPKQDKFLANITIPDGYVVDTLPQSVSIPMSDNNGSMKYMITNKDKQIQLSVVMEINSAILPSEYYEEVKGFFAEVVKKQTEKVVLKKG